MGAYVTPQRRLAWRAFGEGGVAHVKKVLTKQWYNLAIIVPSKTVVDSGDSGVNRGGGRSGSDGRSGGGGGSGGSADTAPRTQVWLQSVKWLSGKRDISEVSGDFGGRPSQAGANSLAIRDPSSAIAT